MLGPLARYLEIARLTVRGLTRRRRSGRSSRGSQRGSRPHLTPGTVTPWSSPPASDRLACNDAGSRSVDAFGRRGRLLGKRVCVHPGPISARSVPLDVNQGLWSLEHRNDLG